MHFHGTFLVRNPQIFRGPAAPRPRLLQRHLWRSPQPLALRLAGVVTMALTTSMKQHNGNTPFTLPYILLPGTIFSYEQCLRAR